MNGKNKLFRIWMALIIAVLTLAPLSSVSARSVLTLNIADTAPVLEMVEVIAGGDDDLAEEEVVEEIEIEAAPAVTGNNPEAEGSVIEEASQVEEQDTSNSDSGLIVVPEEEEVVVIPSASTHEELNIETQEEGPEVGVFGGGEPIIYPEVAVVVLDCSGLVTFKVGNYEEANASVSFQVAINDTGFEYSDTRFVPLVLGQETYVEGFSTVGWPSDGEMFARVSSVITAEPGISESIKCGGEEPDPEIPEGWELVTGRDMPMVFCYNGETIRTTNEHIAQWGYDHGLPLVNVEGPDGLTYFPWPNYPEITRGECDNGEEPANPWLPSTLSLTCETVSFAIEDADEVEYGEQVRIRLHVQDGVWDSFNVTLKPGKDFYEIVLEDPLEGVFQVSLLYGPDFSIMLMGEDVVNCEADTGDGDGDGEEPGDGDGNGDGEEPGDGDGGDNGNGGDNGQNGNGGDTGNGGGDDGDTGNGQDGNGTDDGTVTPPAKPAGTEESGATQEVDGLPVTGSGPDGNALIAYAAMAAVLFLAAGVGVRRHA